MSDLRYDWYPIINEDFENLEYYSKESLCNDVIAITLIGTPKFHYMKRCAPNANELVPF
jgi:hypothetical protein